MKNNIRSSVVRAILFLAFSVGITVVGALGKGNGLGTASAATAVSGEILLKLRSGDAIYVSRSPFATVERILSATQLGFLLSSGVLWR